MKVSQFRTFLTSSIFFLLVGCFGEFKSIVVDNSSLAPDNLALDKVVFIGVPSELIDLKEGDNLYIDIEVESRKEISEYRWEKKIDSQFYFYSSGLTFSISDATTSDAGIYRVVASIWNRKKTQTHLAYSKEIIIEVTAKPDTSRQACEGTPDGGEDSQTFFLSATVAYGEDCEPVVQTRTCSDGVFSDWSGSLTKQSCSVEEPLNCENLAHDQVESKTLYETSSVSYGQSCRSEQKTRSCFNGQLSDWSDSTYTFSTCYVENQSDGGTGLNIVTMTGTSISQFGVTWTFEAPVTYGQFVTGDFFIVGPAKVVSVSPAPSAGRNGSMLNPVPKGGQGFASNGADYEASLSVSYPVEVSAGDALLSSISLDGTEASNWAGGRVSSAARVSTVVVLTVLSTIPPVGSLRPSYSDRSQQLYNINNINTNVLPQIPTLASLPSYSGFSTLGYFERGMERPWILFGNDWQSRSIHPSKQMHNYHQNIGFFLSEASLLLTTDIANKTTLLHRFIQVGIDYYYSKNADSSVWAWPLVFTGLLLNEPKMYDYWINNPHIRTSRGHEKLYYLSDVTPSILSSIIPTGQTWVDWKTPEGKYVAFTKQKGQEYAHLHPSEWQCHSPHCKSEVYRTQHDVYPLIGMTLASILVDKILAADINSKLAHGPIRDYSDRWMSDGFMTKEYRSTGRTYLEEMEFYTDFTIYNYNYGSGGSTFINQMWKTYR